MVATHRGQPVAGAGWCPSPDRPETAALRAVFVDPSHAGQGLGRKLVALAEDMAVTAGYAQLLVPAALNSVGFYRSLGYDPGEEAVLELEDGTPLPYLVMWKHALLMRAPG